MRSKISYKNKMFNNIDEVEVKDNIQDELYKLNYNFTYKGTKYLIDAIYILYCLEKIGEYDFEYDDCNFEKEIYPHISKKYRTSTNNIRYNIAFATDKMTFDCDERILNKYLSDCKFLPHGTKKVCFSVLKKIR